MNTNTTALLGVFCHVQIILWVGFTDLPIFWNLAKNSEIFSLYFPGKKRCLVYWFVHIQRHCLCLVSASNKTSIHIVPNQSMSQISWTNSSFWIHTCVRVRVYRYMYMYFIDCLGHGVLTYFFICGLFGWLGILEFKCWEVCICCLVTKCQIGWLTAY